MDESKDKHIFIEFYSNNCIYCYEFMEEYNKIYDFFMENYGADQIQIFKINGNDLMDLTKKYNVPYFPFFIYMPPNSDGKVTNRFE